MCCLVVCQAAIKSELLQAMVEEREKSVLHKACDTVSELGAELLDRNEWPELLPALQVRDSVAARVEGGLGHTRSQCTTSTSVDTSWGSACELVKNQCLV